MSPHWFFRDLFCNDSGNDVRVVQVKLNTIATGVYDDDTMARVRGWQRLQGLPVDGIVDAATARTLGESATYGQIPGWFQDGLLDEAGLRSALHIGPRVNLEDAIRRFQSSHHHYPTGEMTPQLAIEISE